MKTTKCLLWIGFSMLGSTACSGKDIPLGSGPDELSGDAGNAGMASSTGGSATGGTSSGGSTGTGGTANSTGGSVGTGGEPAMCGGIAAIQCSGDLHCVDSPDDDCDPNQGADCGGVCASFTPIPRCGGFVGEQCGAGQMCVDDPSDDCDVGPAADCPGICADAELTTFCGGIAAFECPTGFTCIDDPRDDCDPNNGGADCGGMCVHDPAQGVSCDLSAITCERFEPGCAAGFVPTADGRCYGPCAPIAACACQSASDCPQGTTCSFDVGRCTPFR